MSTDFTGIRVKKPEAKLLNLIATLNDQPIHELMAEILHTFCDDNGRYEFLYNEVMTEYEYLDFLDKKGVPAMDAKVIKAE